MCVRSEQPQSVLPLFSITLYRNLDNSPACLGGVCLYSDADWLELVCQLVHWCFEASQPQRITSGLNLSVEGWREGGGSKTGRDEGEPSDTRIEPATSWSCVKPLNLIPTVRLQLYLNRGARCTRGSNRTSKSPTPTHWACQSWRCSTRGEETAYAPRESWSCGRCELLEPETELKQSG